MKRLHSSTKADRTKTVESSKMKNEKRSRKRSEKDDEEEVVEKVVANKPQGKSSSKQKSKKEIGSKSIEYFEEVKELEKTVPIWHDFFNPKADDHVRGDCWVRLDVVGNYISNKYAWAVPDEQALKIVSHFSPIIEIGSGKGYWASLLRERGVDIVASDISVDAAECWTEVVAGGPELISAKKNRHRNLLLCYPDEADEVSISCLENFKGEYIIHIGEMITTGGSLAGSLQSPFGRTTSSEFQVRLAETFHCLLNAALPRFPFSKDTISVWKRTVYVEGNRNKDEYEREDDDDDNDEGEEEADTWAYIPDDERLPSDTAAPCLAFLLQQEKL